MEYVLKHPVKVIDFLKNKPPNTRKTMLAMLVSLTDDDKYREAMLDEASKSKKELEKQEKSNKQKDNWMDWEEVVQVFDHMYKRSLPLLKKETLTGKETEEMMDLVLLACYVLIPPRRSQDYAKMKVRGFNEKEDNYYKKSKFYFNQFKTAKFYGKQEVQLPSKLNTLVTRWMKKTDNDYLLFDKQGKPLTNVKITTRLNKIFGKKISSSMLRHIFLSHKLKDAPTLKEMKEMADEMGHSVEEQQLYRKVS
jgi:hypothetical protein